MNNLPIPKNDDELMALAREALTEALDREPTYQETLKAHAGFKRMAFVMMEHLERQDKEEKSNTKNKASE